MNYIILFVPAKQNVLSGKVIDVIQARTDRDAKVEMFRRRSDYRRQYGGGFIQCVRKELDVMDGDIMKNSA
jgi:hypothetical protein